MDMYKKRELRAKKKQEESNNDKSCTSVNINCPILPNVKSALNPYK